MKRKEEKAVDLTTGNGGWLGLGAVDGSVGFGASTPRGPLDNTCTADCYPQLVSTLTQSHRSTLHPKTQEHISKL